MRKLLVQPEARLDLLEIWHHIARDDLRAANRVFDKLDSAICGLVDMPTKGHTRADVRHPAYRFWTIYSYVIAYRFDDETLIVIRVVHGRRNLKRLLR